MTGRLATIKAVVHFIRANEAAGMVPESAAHTALLAKQCAQVKARLQEAPLTLEEATTTLELLAQSPFTSEQRVGRSSERDTTNRELWPPSEDGDAGLQ